MAIFGDSVNQAVNETIEITETLAEEVWVGLRQSPKRISSRFLYDDEGSRLFQAIMNLPEYYLTRTELDILRVHKQALLELFADGRPFALIELGAGDGLKTKVLLEHFWQQNSQFSYAPVDISRAALDELTDSVRAQWPELLVQPLHAEYLTALRQLAESSNRQPVDVRRVVLFLGSNIGNFAPAEAVAFYEQISAHLQPGDLLLTGFDLQKHPALIQAAYNDSQGVTRAFNLNLLRRINRELDANFDLLAFDHYETYHPETGEARSYLVSQQKQTVTIAALGMTVPFERGEVIYTEMSRKFTRAQIEDLAQQAGFRVVGWFADEQGYFVDAVYEKE